MHCATLSHLEFQKQDEAAVGNEEAVVGKGSLDKSKELISRANTINL